MNQVNRITIHAPLHKIFLAAADLTRWPEFLSHYRHNRFLSQTPSGGVVKMSCVHAGVPLTGIYQFHLDPERRELRFTQLRSTSSTTGGLEAVWTFEERPGDGIEVTIAHQQALSLPSLGRFIANKLLGGAVIQRIAEKTLAGLKRKVEAQQHAETSAAKGRNSRPATSDSAAGAKSRPRTVPGVRKKPLATKSTRAVSKKPTPTKRKSSAKLAAEPKSAGKKK